MSARRQSSTSFFRSKRIIHASDPTPKGFKRTLFIRAKLNQKLFGVIPFAKLQNDT